ncbi:MAG: hypothetical protein BGO09_07860 [Bacteroidetes bacterium 47-18]|nr:MAG: hypothetical protein BGO09_07860 [Bacteroidetes bacterium 47-18]
MKKIYAFVIILLVSCVSFKGNAQCGVASRELLGSVSAMTAYNTYIVIGSFADMFTQKVITAKQLSDYLDEQIPMLTTVTESYGKALQNDAKSYSEDDKRFMNECIHALNMLAAEARALRLYADVQNDSNASEYQKYRKKAWSAISDLLGLEEE